MREFVSVLVVCAFLGIMACSGDVAEEKNGAVSSIFTDATKEVLPCYIEAEAPPAAESAGDMLSIKANYDPSPDTWRWGMPIFEFYAMLADDNPGAYFNLYDELRWADGRYGDAIKSGSNIAAVEVKASWEVGFNTGDTGIRTYNKIHEYHDSGYFSRTYAREDGTLHCVLNWIEIDRWSEGGEKSKSIVQAVFDKSSGDLKLGMFMANFVRFNESVSSWEIVRAYAVGNTETRIFTLKVIRNGYYLDSNIIGYGIARGAENGNYFLLKMMYNGMGAPNTFYTFPANYWVDGLKSLDNAGSVTPQGDTRGYANNLPGHFTSSDIPTPALIEALSAP